MSAGFPFNSWSSWRLGLNFGGDDVSCQGGVRSFAHQSVAERLVVRRRMNPPSMIEHRRHIDNRPDTPAAAKDARFTRRRHGVIHLFTAAPANLHRLHF